MSCRSWRHEGDCRRWRGAQDFARIREALGRYEEWTYMVMTYPRDEEVELEDVYRALWRNWKSLRQWIERNFAGVDLDTGERVRERVKYVALVEQHRDGYPHLNLLVHHSALCRAANQDWRRLRDRLKEVAERCGFGPIFWLEPLKSKDAIAGYMVKLGHEADEERDRAAQLAGELAKPSQIPVAAPRGFRRLRASQGLLPPAHRDPNRTGVALDAPAADVCWARECGQAVLASDIRHRTQILVDRDEVIDTATGEVLNVLVPVVETGWDRLLTASRQATAARAVTSSSMSAGLDATVAGPAGDQGPADQGAEGLAEIPATAFALADDTS